MDDKPNRSLSQGVWENIHIDDLNKAIIVVGIRAKEDYVATLETTRTDLLEVLDDLLTHLWDNRKRDVKKDYSLMVAEVAAQKAISKAKG